MSRNSRSRFSIKNAVLKVFEISIQYVKSVQIRTFFWPVFSLVPTEYGEGTERYGVSLRIWSECGRMRTRKNSVFAHFSRSARKKRSWSLFLKQLFQHRGFPGCEWLLHLLLKLDEMGVRQNYVLCLFVLFWYYNICIFSRSSRSEVFFKKLLLQISQNSQEKTCAGVLF